MIRQGTFLEIDSQDTRRDSFDRHVVATAAGAGAGAGAERDGAPSTIIVSKSRKRVEGGRREEEEEDDDDGVTAVPCNRILLRRDLVCYLSLSLAGLR